MLKNLVKKLDLEQNVIFLGKIDYGLLPHYYNLCDIFVLPSIEEGLGFVSAEALACLKPVVASNVGGIPDIIIHNKTGILIERKNPEALSDAIIKLLKDKNLAKRLALNGQSHIKKNFEEERVMEKFKNAIELSLPNIKNYGFNKDLKS
jgi:glycosyltransferase involved in cell wall biosynthesis